MIYRIYSDLPTFKNLTFHAGLNILLADKSPDASDRQTRNRAGKSSLIEVIHFLAGANVDKNSLFAKDALVPQIFGAELDLDGQRVTVERSGSKRNKVFIQNGRFSGWPYVPEVDRGDDKPSLSNSHWRVVLGQIAFKLSQEVQNQGWGPKFRSLFSYFVRREHDGGFRSPMKQSVPQQKGDEQVALTFLIGLDWTIPQQLQRTRERERTLRELRRAAGEGTLGEVIGTTAQLRTALTVTEDKARRLAKQLADFRVLPQYREYEAEASTLTRQIANLNDDNTMDRQYVAQLEDAVNKEQAPSIPDVERIFREAGVTLPQSVQRRFEDVRQFHDSIIQNRKSYLEGEMEGTRRRIAEREQQKGRLDARRAELMRILSSHGALEHFSSLQAEHTKLTTEAERLRQQYETAQHLESEKTELEAERNRLYQRLRQDVQEQRNTVENAILAFERVSSSLYEEAGRLTLNETTDGPEFEVTIQGARSAGINKMQIFCFDMMLMQLCSERGLGPGFLVHDSHLFDGVDERQIAHALRNGARLASENNFQYIVTMNSDDLPLPSLFPDDFDISQYILPIRLTDQTEEGGLFGFRFD